MKTHSFLGWMGVAAALSITGCARISTQVVEKPRVDQEIPGNQGYLVGSAPEGAARKTTRQMLQTDIELRTLDEMNPWRKNKPAAQPNGPAASAEPVEVSPAPAPEREWEDPAPEEYSPAPVSSVGPAVTHAPESAVSGGTTYVVQKGDTLEKISAKVYGTTRKWRRIYDANRGILKSPNRVYVGQKLTIPAEETEPAETESSGDSQYK